MIISRGEKEEIRELLVSHQDMEQGLKRLFKLKNSNLETIDDKYWVLFSLALGNKLNGNMQLAKMYIDELKMVLDTAPDTYNMEKAMTLWLYIELNKNILDEELLTIYETIYENIKHLGEEDEKVLGVKANISFLNNNYNEVLKIFNDCLQRQYIRTIDSILKDLDDKNKIMYNKALKIKEQYDREINVI